MLGGGGYYVVASRLLGGDCVGGEMTVNLFFSGK